MTSPRGAAPAWKPPYILPRVPNIDHTYVEAEDWAYHRVNGLPFRKRTKPEIPATGKHPRCAYRNLPSIPVKMRNIRGQLQAFHERQWQESQDSEQGES